MSRSIFERCGGFAVVHKVVMSFYDRALDSDLLGPYFDDVDMRRLIDHQTKFVAQVMGGPVTYSNDVLQQLHAHLGVTGAAFDEMVGLMRTTLEDFDFAADDVAFITAELRARRPFIVAPSGEEGGGSS